MTDALIQKLMQQPYLTPEEERRLATNWIERRCVRSRDRLVAAHGRLAVKWAKTYSRWYKTVDLYDLVQEAMLGLTKAAEKYELGHGSRFGTYAGWWIRAALQDYVLTNRSVVACSRTGVHKRLFFKLNSTRRKVIAEAERTLNEVEIAERVAAILEVPVEVVEKMGRWLKYEDTDMAGTELWMADDGPLPDQIVEEQLDAEKRSRDLREALGVLNTRERKIIEARGLGEERATLESLSEQFGVSKERVRQIEVKAMEKLKRQLLNPDPELVAA